MRSGPIKMILYKKCYWEAAYRLEAEETGSRQTNVEKGLSPDKR